jgi:integrase
MRGSVQKRTGKNGTVSYMVRVEMPADPVTGERRQRAKTFKTRKEADAELAKWLVEIERGTSVEPSKLAVGELLTMWLDDVARHKVRATSHEDYRNTIDKHLIPALGSVLAQKLTPAQVQAFYGDKLANGTGTRTVQLCHQRLSQALSWAVRMGLVIRNVCDVVDPPRAKPKQTRVWTTQEAQRFLDAAGTWEPFFTLMLSTGLRRGECLGVRWCDVDLDARTLKVRQSVVILAGKAHAQEPKTASAQRTVKLPVETVAALREHRTRQLERRLSLGPLWNDQDLVFPNETGGLIHPCNAQRAYSATLNRADVPKLRMHDLRHTHATWLLLAGQPVKAVSERLGHARTSTTVDTYAHTMPDTQDATADLAGQLLFRREA